MSIEQEINRNTMTIAELVKAVRDLTDAIKGAGTAAAKAGNAFEKLSATAEANPRMFHTTMKPGAPTIEYTAQDIADLATLVQQVDSGDAPVADVNPIEQGPFYWSHPESGSYGMVKTRAELDEVLAADGCCDEVSAERYIQIVADENAAAAQKAKHADENRYFHDTVHRAAYKIAPTEPLNGLQARAGVEEINAEQYAVLKAEYTKLTDQVIAGNAKVAADLTSLEKRIEQYAQEGLLLPKPGPTTGRAPAATPPSAPAAAAPSPTVTSSEPPPSAPEPAASPAEPPAAEPPWPEVHATLMRLVKTAGCGSTALIALLKDFGVERPKTALALQTEAVGRFAEIIANAERRMKGGAA